MIIVYISQGLVIREYLSQIFNNFRNDNPNALKKVTAIEGDMGEKNLGLSASSEQKLFKEVEIVFHIAAMLKLDANLKDAVIMNVEGTLTLLNLATKMEKLLVRITRQPTVELSYECTYAVESFYRRLFIPPLPIAIVIFRSWKKKYIRPKKALTM